jgi:hypothetical protein
MCPIKTQNISINVSREEGQFWKELAFKMRMRSCGDLHKFLLLLGLEEINPSAAKRLKSIRESHIGVTATTLRERMKKN